MGRQTVFCLHCGFVLARGTVEEVERARQESPYSACPGCGATAGVGSSPTDLSPQQVQRLLHPDVRVVARPDESPRALAERMRQEMSERLGVHSQRERAKRWLLRVGLTMLVVGLLAGGSVFQLTHELGRAIALGLAGGLAGGWVADRFVESPFS